VANLDLFLPIDEDGGSDGVLSPTVLSGSSVNTYLRCQKQWEYAYVLQLRRPPSIKQGLGITAHEAVALNYEQKTLTFMDLPTEEVVQKFEDSWDILAIEIEDITEEAKIGKRGNPLKSRKENKARARASGIKAVMLHHEGIASQIQPVWVERQIQFKINDLIDWTGIFDLSDNKNRVRDNKFVSRKPQDAGPYMIPMIGYALGYRQITDSIESEVVLDNVVRTEEPYYLPLASGGPITDDAIAQFVRIVTQVKRSIDAGIFLPTGLQSHACGWCGYADICPAYKAANAGRNV
jgi:CRISPR/Cas system-associated exonuclease Cas4 (RecB family)